MPARLIEYPQGLAVALAAPAMQRALGAKMEKARAYAMAISPVRTGRFKYGAVLLHDGNDPGGHRRRRAGGNFEALPSGQVGGFRVLTGVRGGRAYARLINITSYAVYLEFGTRYMRRRRILGRAADALKL